MVEVAELEKQFSELIQKLQPFEVLSTNAGILLEEPATGNMADGSVAVKPAAFSPFLKIESIDYPSYSPNSQCKPKHRSDKGG